MTLSGDQSTHLALFRHVGDDSATAIMITVDGQPFAARPGDSLATALIAGGMLAFARNPKTGALASPACLMGICFGCLCEVDGRPGVQACLTSVSAGMQVRTRVPDDLPGAGNAGGGVS